MGVLKQQALDDIDRTQTAANDIAGSNVAGAAIMLRACVERWAPPGSAYTTEPAERKMNPHVAAWKHYRGAIAALRGDIDNNALDRFAARVRSAAFSDLLAQAAELVDSNFVRAAAVLGGAALEAHLRSLAVLHGIPTSVGGGRAAKASNLNEQLASKGVYPLTDRDQNAAHLRTRHEAAHPDPAFDNRSNGEIKRMLASVEDFVTKYPA
jgi:hypothetical protein